METNNNLEWKEVQPNIWKPETKGDQVEGVLIGKDSNKGSFESMAYSIETKDKAHLLIWGCAVLDERMKYVNVGEEIKVVFDGEGQNKKGQNIKLFKVYKK
jgi:hypothetical protein